MLAGATNIVSMALRNASITAPVVSWVAALLDDGSTAVWRAALSHGRRTHRSDVAGYM